MLRSLKHHTDPAPVRRFKEALHSLREASRKLDDIRSEAEDHVRQHGELFQRRLRIIGSTAREERNTLEHNEVLEVAALQESIPSIANLLRAEQAEIEAIHGTHRLQQLQSFYADLFKSYKELLMKTTQRLHIDLDSTKAFFDADLLAYDEINHYKELHETYFSSLYSKRTSDAQRLTDMAKYTAKHGTTRNIFHPFKSNIYRFLGGDADHRLTPSYLIKAAQVTASIYGVNGSAHRLAEALRDVLEEITREKTTTYRDVLMKSAREEAL